MRMMAQIGAGSAALAFLVFVLIWLRIAKKQETGRQNAGTWLDAAGFGLLPGLAVWKAFEPFVLETGINGKPLFEPLESLGWLSAYGRFYPGRMELCGAAAAFTGIALWLFIRKKDMPGNGDVAWTVLCLWSAIRSVTDSLRETTVRIAGLNAMIAAAVLAEIIVLAIWTVRRGRKQKNAGLTAMEWAAVTACGAVLLIQDAGILSPGSGIARLAISVGCAILSAALILSAGKDSREEPVTGG